MSEIPGFSSEGLKFVDVSADNGTKKVTTIEIAGHSDWRVEVPFHTILKLNVTRGIVEIFGTELPVNVELQFSGAKICLYTPDDEGCEIQYSTTVKSSSNNKDDNEISEYISDETTMNQTINLHFALESYRQQAVEYNAQNTWDQKKGPRVLVVGSAHSGKTSLIKTLASYSLKMDGCPILVNLNPQEGVFSLPGSLTATPISDLFDVESTNGWGNTTTSGSTFHNPKQPIVKNYGFENFNENIELYKYQISKLGVAVMSRLEEDINVKNSGLLVDTPPLSMKDITVIENIVSDYEINFIVVIGNERLLIDLKKKFKHKTQTGALNVIKIAKSGGVVEIDDSFMRNSQQQAIREYFYGTLKSPLSPYNTVIDVKDVVLFKSVDNVESNSNFAFLPSGDSFTPEDSDMTEADKRDDFSLERYYSPITNPTASDLNNTILAITQLQQNDKLGKNLLNTCVMGYAYVSDVDDTKGKMRILLPVPGALPRNILIVTGIRYME